MTFPTEWKVIKFHGSKPTRIGLESGLHWLCPPVGARIARPGCLGPYLSWRPFRILDVCPPVFSNVAGQLLCHGALQLERAMVDCPLLIEGKPDLWICPIYSRYTQISGQISYSSIFVQMAEESIGETTLHRGLSIGHFGTNALITAKMFNSEVNLSKKLLPKWTS